MITIDYTRFWCKKCALRVTEQVARLGYHELVIRNEGIITTERHIVVPMPEDE